MECTRWVEEGLLLSSEELGSEESRNYKEHLKECEVCRIEQERYEEQRSVWFTEGILGEKPSSEVDRKIFAACAKTPRPTSTFMPSFVYAKRFSLALLLLFLGVGTGTYFAYNLGEKQDRDFADGIKEESNVESSVAEAQVAVDEKDADAVGQVAQSDSAADSIAGETPEYQGSKPLDNMIPVDLRE